MSDATPWGLAALVALVAATVAHHWFWVRRLTVSLPYDEHHRITTPDGGAFELRRVRAERPRPGAPPALLVHGVAIDHRNHDLLADLSLARHLAASGVDCWLLTLRSGRADLRWRERALVRFDAMVTHDVPRAVAEVRARTGTAAVDYVGFSMGGMLLYAALGRTVDAAHVRRAVIIGSPAQVHRRGLTWAARLVARLPLVLWPTLPLRLASQMVAFLAEPLRTPIHRHVCNPENFGPGVMARAMMSIHDIPAALSRDFVRWAGHGGPIDVAGASVLEGLARCAQPALFFAGAADRVAPPASVRLAFDAWGRAAEGVEKRFVRLGAADGAAADYGHGDLAFGRAAHADVFEPVREFLAR